MSETTALRREPDADWNAVWSAMQELGAAMAPLFELTSPPSWAVTIRFAMDVALPDIEEHCAEANEGEKKVS